MTPAETRIAFNDAIDYYRRAWPSTDTSKRAAKILIGALDVFPWLRDQIPHDIERMARREANGLSPVAP